MSTPNRRFRKLPVVVEAMRYGPYSTPTLELLLFIGNGNFGENGLQIHTDRGVMIANLGDWIIKGVNGEVCRCPDDVFRKTYEAVPPEEEEPFNPLKNRPDLVLDGLELSVRTRRVLGAWRYDWTMNDFMNLTQKEVLALRGAGPVVWNEIAEKHAWLNRCVAEAAQHITIDPASFPEAPHGSQVADIVDTLNVIAAMKVSLSEVLAHLSAIEREAERYVTDTDARANIIRAVTQARALIGTPK